MGEEESELLKVLKGFKERISQKYNIKEMILFSSQVSIVRQAIKEGIII
ncbi:MAG: hypothetical protein U9N61_05865 [Euryarchaeota archaeon]|nr:hypothetical protein [Euryarchaeota archaeon]